MGRDNLGNHFVGTDIPNWMKRRSTIREQNKSTRRKQIIDRNNKYFFNKWGQPPLTREQQLAGARRIL